MKPRKELASPLPTSSPSSGFIDGNKTIKKILFMSILINMIVVLIEIGILALVRFLHFLCDTFEFVKD